MGWLRLSKQRIWALQLGAIALGAGVVVALDPRLLGLAAAAVVCVYLLTTPLGRLAWFILGAMLVFQSGEGLTVSKLGYLVGVVLSVVLALPRLGTVLSTTWGARFAPAVRGAGLLAAWVALVTSIHSMAVRGIQMEVWSRDALTYLLISVAVVLGVDAASSVPKRQARVITAAVGAVAAIGFAMAWLERRLASGVPANQDLLASMVAVSVPLALALTLGLAGRGFRMRWLLCAVGLVSAVLVTGTRSGVVLAVAVVGLIGARSKSRVPAAKAAGGLLLAMGAVAVALPVLWSLFTPQGFREGRWNSAVRVLTEGFQQDQSGVIRARAYGYAVRIFEEQPLLGQGLGVLFPNPNPGGAAANFSLDTPLVFLAKFGVFGTAVLAVALWLIVSSFVRRHGSPWLPEMTAARGSVTVWVVLLPFGATTEDKGFAVSVALLALLVGSASREQPGTVPHGAASRGDGVDDVLLVGVRTRLAPKSWR